MAKSKFIINEIYPGRDQLIKYYIFHFAKDFLAKFYGQRKKIRHVGVFFYKGQTDTSLFPNPSQNMNIAL